MPRLVPVESATEQRALLQIGQVAERVGLSLRTVRYYEEVGLLEPTSRSQGGFRLYSEDQVERLRVLKAMKPFGITLEEIRELMDLLDRSADVEALAPAERLALGAALEAFGVRADERLEKLEQHILQVRALRKRIRDRADRLRPASGSV